MANQWTTSCRDTVKRVVVGDTFFPDFEDQFTAVADVLENDEFKIIHYVHRDRLLA